jgi:predicted permease
VDLCFLQHWFSGLLACQLHIYEDYESRGKKQGVWQLADTFSNIGYMGFPVIDSVFGDHAVHFYVDLTWGRFLCLIH